MKRCRQPWNELTAQDLFDLLRQFLRHKRLLEESRPALQILRQAGDEKLRTAADQDRQSWPEGDDFNEKRFARHVRQTHVGHDQVVRNRGILQGAQGGRAGGMRVHFESEALQVPFQQQQQLRLILYDQYSSSRHLTRLPEAWRRG
jgi:hypothetical protein